MLLFFCFWIILWILKDIELGLRNLYAGVIYDALYFDLNYKNISLSF